MRRRKRRLSRGKSWWNRNLHFHGRHFQFKRKRFQRKRFQRIEQ
jgi:hypothetical protein